MISITTTNDAASSTIGAIGGTAAGTRCAPLRTWWKRSGSGSVSRNWFAPTLVAQYNNILDQITTTAQDASYNGVNLLNGDQLKLTFNETGTSTLKIQGVPFNIAGLGLTQAERRH